MQKLRLPIILLSLLFSLCAQTQTCQQLFLKARTVKPPSILSVTKALLSANKNDVELEDFFLKRKYKITQIYTPSEKYSGEFKIYQVELQMETYATKLGIRFNGKMAFLDKSFGYRNYRSMSAKKYKAIVVDNLGQLRPTDQGELLLRALPEDVLLSRSLNEKKREEWLSDSIPAVTYFRQHFAYQYYKFDKREPYFFTFTKQELLDLYFAGALEINTYDATGKYAMPELARNPVGIEFELVFIGSKGYDLIKERMKDGLRQQVLSF